ncbi:MAG: AAA family ATPase [Actinobacteria bacterium]|nr:AAA family ATPase [Actinomycetota bacterium]
MKFFKKIKSDKLLKDNKSFKLLTQKTISIYSFAGGVGRTSIAIHLAHYFSNYKTLLIDLNFIQGDSDLSLYLKLKKLPHLSNFLIEDNPEKSFSNTIVKPDNYKFDVIQAPPSIRQSDNIKIKTIDNLIDIARDKYGLIIIDLPYSYSNLVMHVLNKSTDVIMVTNDNLGSISRLKEIGFFVFEKPKIIYVYNKYEKHVSLYKPKEIEGYLVEDINVIGYDDKLKYRMSKNIINTDVSTTFGEGIINLVHNSIIK